MKILKWITLRKISLSLYVVSLLIPALCFSQTALDVGFIDDPERFKTYHTGLTALAYGWLEGKTLIPWFSNILYFFVIATKLRKKSIGFIILILAMIFALLILNFDMYDSNSHFGDPYPQKVSIETGFYFWISSYAILAIEPLKEIIKKYRNNLGKITIL